MTKAKEHFRKMIVKDFEYYLEDELAGRNLNKEQIREAVEKAFRHTKRQLTQTLKAEFGTNWYGKMAKEVLKV